MTDSAVELKVLETRTFHHTDTIKKGPITANLYEGVEAILEREDGYKVSLAFSPFISTEDQLMFFDAFATPEFYERFKYDRNMMIDFLDASFAHFLINNKIPKNLAIRLTLAGRKVEDKEDLFESYRNLKQTFFYNQKTGQSSFEIYLLMAGKFGVPFADSVFKLKSLSLEMLEKAYEDVKNINLHEDVKGQIAMTTPESFETFMVLKNQLRLDTKQNAMVLARLVADDGTINWTTVTELHRRLNAESSIEDLIDLEKEQVGPEMAMIYAQAVRTAPARAGILARLRDRPGNDAVSTIFAVLIAKYGVGPILSAMRRIEGDPLTEGTIAAFIVVADFIGQTGDSDTNLKWILLLSGDMDESNFE